MQEKILKVWILEIKQIWWLFLFAKIVSIEMSSAMVEFALNLTRENRSTVEVIGVREVLFIGYFSIYLRLQIYLISHYRLFLTYLKSIIRKLYH